MSLKAELETWSEALAAYDTSDLPRSLEIFTTIAESSKVHFNIGLIHATQGHHTQAVKAFRQATELDRFFAVAYFQRGVSMFLTAEWERAKMQFEMALSNMRGNDKIDYTQLGLPFNLFLPEIHFNLALCHIKQKDVTKGMYELRKASTRKMTPAHEVIEEAIEKRGEGFTVFSIPVGVLFRPSENKLKNLAPKDYKGKAKLIAVSSTEDEYTTFTGVTRLGRKQTPSGTPMDAHQISRSKTLMRMGHRPNDADGEAKTIKSFSTRDLGGEGEGQEFLGPETDDKSRAVKDLGDLMDRRFSPSSSLGSGSKETLLSPPGSSLPVPIASDEKKSKGGGFMRRSNTLRELMRFPSFLSKSSSGSSGTAKDKDKRSAPPIVTRGLDSVERNSVGTDMGRSASEPSFAKPADLGPRTAPADGYRGQLQYGGPATGGSSGTARDERFSTLGTHKQLSPLRPKRPGSNERYNTSAEIFTRASPSLDVPAPMQRSASAIQTSKDAAQHTASFRSAPVTGQLGHDRTPTAPIHDDASVYSQATGKYPAGAVGPAFVFEEEDTKVSPGKSRARAEVRMTELYDGYYGSADSNRDDDDSASVPIPPVPSFNNARLKQCEPKRPPRGQAERPNPTVLMHNLEGLRLQQQEKSGSPILRPSPASSIQESPIVTIPQSYEHGGISLTKKPNLLTPQGTGSGNDFRRQPTFRRSPLNSSNFDDGELIDMEMQSIRVKIRYNDDIRAVVISPHLLLHDFRMLLCDKFEIPDMFKLRFRDEEGDQVSLKDEGDWDAALDYARVTAAGRPEGRLDVWLL